jgi:hypothetical protein
VRSRSATTGAPRPRTPLRTDPGIAFEEVEALLGLPDVACTDADWKEWRSVVRALTAAVRARPVLVPLPRCRGQEHVDLWLEELNALVGEAESFADGEAYELLDLDPGSDAYCILLCRKGTRLVGAAESLAGKDGAAAALAAAPASPRASQSSPRPRRRP